MWGGTLAPNLILARTTVAPIWKVLNTLFEMPRRHTWVPRFTCWAALLAFFFTLVPLEAFHPEQTGEAGEAALAAEHPGDCPDGLPDGVPCSTNCACLCCPGHVRSLPAGELAPARSPLGLTGALFERSVEIRLKEIVFSFFRPPRAA